MRQPEKPVIYKGFEIETGRYEAPWGVKGDLWWAEGTLVRAKGQEVKLEAGYYGSKDTAVTALYAEIDRREAGTPFAVRRARRLARLGAPAA